MQRFVFGESLEKAATVHAPEIDDTDAVLILGGGTGKILQSISECRSISYLDKSEKMVARAMKRKSLNQTEWLVEDFLEFSSDLKYDIIICPFFLDCFNEEHLGLATDKIKSLMAENGKLLVSDFQENKSGFLIPLMHTFFRFFASLESKRLKNIHGFILERRFTVEKEEFFHKNMIFSRVYRNL